MANPLPDRFAEAHALLRKHFGFPGFRPAQRWVLQSVLLGRDTLAVLPTGGGKSLFNSKQPNNNVMMIFTVVVGIFGVRWDSGTPQRLVGFVPCPWVAVVRFAV
ncbi:MAG: hypothetical protein O7E49_00800 [Gemmatimonadetes bacterium]|nr:hypothetical protein [Gemmatimonadota bacterium]